MFARESRLIISHTPITLSISVENVVVNSSDFISLPNEFPIYWIVLTYTHNHSQATSSPRRVTWINKYSPPPFNKLLRVMWGGGGRQQDTRSRGKVIETHSKRQLCHISVKGFPIKWNLSNCNDFFYVCFNGRRILRSKVLILLLDYVDLLHLIGK